MPVGMFVHWCPEKNEFGFVDTTLVPDKSRMSEMRYVCCLLSVIVIDGVVIVVLSSHAIISMLLGKIVALVCECIILVLVNCRLLAW